MFCPLLRIVTGKRLQGRPPRDLSLEAMLEYIQEDEQVEITPKPLRMRKRILLEAGRKRAGRRLSVFIGRSQGKPA